MVPRTLERLAAFDFGFEVEMNKGVVQSANTQVVVNIDPLVLGPAAIRPLMDDVRSNEYHLHRWVRCLQV